MHAFKSLAVLLLSSTAAFPAIAASDETGSNASDRALTETGETDASEGADTSGQKAQKAASGLPQRAFTTGVAKGRDMLDTAISASTLDEETLHTLSVSSVAGILQNIPGFRSETSDIDGFSAITIRGLPLAAEGSKWVQLQEDGLPVLEFGDIQFAAADQFLRADLGMAQVQTIRGGSASTFASNSPGGVVNFLSNTGAVEGGTVQLSSGVGHDLQRIDFSYGAPIGSGWRFHVGGFYREGEGPRDIGYNGFRGGQVKANVTRDFDGGYIRFSGKYLDDRQPNYGLLPVTLSGTNEDVEVNPLPGFDITSEANLSPAIANYSEVDRNNNPTLIDLREGVRGQSSAIGMEAKFDISGWSVTNKFRFSSNSGAYNETLPFFVGPAASIAPTFAGPGAVATFAAGPQAGNPVGPATPLALDVVIHAELESIDYAVNDLRASRVWDIGSAKLTTTGGLYASNQQIDMFWNFTSLITDLAGGEDIVPVNLTTATGVPVTDVGIVSYGIAGATPELFARRYNLEYDIIAPYGSVNFATGKLALGASVRWDNGKVNGDVIGADFPGAQNVFAPIDVNGNGLISLPESAVVVLPLSQPSLVDYDYDYFSYSLSANYRIDEPVSVFGRYSRGGRANAESVITAGSLNPATGELVNPDQVFTTVDQAEVGVKYRTSSLELFVTGFWASTEESNTQIAGDASGQSVVLNIDRSYSAIGVEFEGSYSTGPFTLALGANYTKAEIDDDSIDQTLIGNTPRHIPDFAFFARPQIDLGAVTFGSVITGTTESFAQDSNILVQPAYVLVSPFVRYRMADQLTLALNAFNVFDEQAIVQISASEIPASGFTNAQVMNGRTVSAALAFTF